MRNCQVSMRAKRPTSVRSRAHQREVMVAVGLADAAHALQGGRIAEMPAQGIARVGRVGDEAAAAHDLRGLADQAQLRGDGV